MANSNDRNLNVTIRNQADEKDEVVISVSSIIKKLKKYFLPWIIIAAMVGVYMVSMQTIDSMKTKKPITALVGFNYAGVEKGLDPKGGALDVNSLKNPEVISDALSSLDIDLNKVETIRSHISIAGIIPSNAIDRITLYKSVINQTGSITAAQNLLDTTYFSTQYKVTFNYSGTGLSTEKAVEVLNTMLEKYRDYFYKQYGYNQSLGSSVATNDYKTYDYAEAVDLFSNNLTTLQTYLKKLADEDVTRFRSSKGYTFGDLYESAKTVKELDLDKAESLVTVNNLTKDKNQTVAFYKYKIETLGRNRDQYIETYNALVKTRESYQKDSIILMQGAAPSTTEGTSNTGTSATQKSEEYDKLIEREYELSANIAKTKQLINTYTARLEALQKSSGKNTSDGLTEELVKELEIQLERINDKINNLVDIAKTTTDEYYQNVQLANAYSVLVPSSKTATSTIRDVIESSMRSVAVTEALIFLVYFGLAFVAAIISENRKKTRKIINDLQDANAAAAAAAPAAIAVADKAVEADTAEEQEEEDDDDTDELIDEVAEALGAEEEVTELQKSGPNGEKKPVPVSQKSSKKSKKK